MTSANPTDGSSATPNISTAWVETDVFFYLLEKNKNHETTETDHVRGEA